MKYFSIITIVTVLICVISCTKDIGPDPALNRTIDCDTITFTKHVKPIIQANCISCHTPGGPGQVYGHADYTTDMYAGLKDKVDKGELQSHAIELTATPTMPLGMDPLPKAQRDILRCWVNAGAPNN